VHGLWVSRHKAATGGKSQRDGPCSARAVNSSRARRVTKHGPWGPTLTGGFQRDLLKHPVSHREAVCVWFIPQTPQSPVRTVQSICASLAQHRGTQCCLPSNVGMPSWAATVSTHRESGLLIVPQQLLSGDRWRRMQSCFWPRDSQRHARPAASLRPLNAGRRVPISSDAQDLQA
jgi:hypothetical protein